MKNMDTGMLRLKPSTWSSLVLFVFLFFVLAAGPSSADRRPEGMAGGERVVVTAQSAPSADAGFYRKVSRRLAAAMENLRFSDFAAARLNVRWAEARLERHGKPEDLGFVRDLARCRSFIRHYQLGPAFSVLARVDRAVRTLGWGGVTAVEVTVPPKRSESADPSLKRKIDLLVTELRNNNIAAARKSLRKMVADLEKGGGEGSSPSAPGNSLSPGQGAAPSSRGSVAGDEPSAGGAADRLETLRLLKSLLVHFDEHTAGGHTEALVETLRGMTALKPGP